VQKAAAIATAPLTHTSLVWSDLCTCSALKVSFSKAYQHYVHCEFSKAIMTKLEQLTNLRSSCGQVARTQAEFGRGHGWCQEEHPIKIALKALKPCCQHDKRHNL